MGKRLYTWLLLSLGVAMGAFAQSKTISGGNDHGLIICAEGYLYTWGNNYSSIMAGPLLGIDPSESGYDDKIVYSPKRVKTGNLTFSQVTSGSGAFNLALSCHKVVYAWGDNQNDGCGQGGQGGNVVSFPTPVLKGETPGYNEDGSTGGPYLGGVTYIAASTNSGFAIMNDGRVVGWGKGEWNSATGNNAGLPRYIKDKAGNDIKNVTHISGGDDNCLIRTEDGSLYGIGPWNGNSNATSTVAVPVLKADDNTPLTDIRMSAAGDVCGFAVTGDGYVWSWGNGGWGGSTGQQRQGLTHYNAMKVASGEYKTISGEEYLTDIKEVIGGRGHGAAVSKEGYLVYWGCDEDNGGVAPTNAATKTKYPNGAQGVLPILARYCDASGKPGELVKDAVSISRGDNFDFMVNDKDEFYVWGLNDLGQCGVGSATVSKYTCLTKLTTIPCEIQDGCPEVYMINRMKCPGEEIELDCGFTVPKGKEERYFVTWMYEGKVLNSSTTTDPESVRAADPYNVTSIKVTKTGEYTVTIEYIGGNIPCDKCKIAKTSCTVKEMEMPIDTIVTTMNCVADPLKPAASDNICFKAVVNNSFYKATQKTTFAAFSTKDSKDTLAVVETTGAGGKIEFCVSGDKIDKTQVHDNKNEAEPDTTYTVWLEDVSTFDTYLNKNAKLTTAGSFQSYGLLIDIYSDAILKSFTFSAKSHSGETTISVTPVLYEAIKNTNDLYVVGNRVQSGKAQSFTIDDSGPQDVVVNCDFVIEGNPTRGVRYILGMNIGTSNFQLYTGSVAAVKENSAEFTTPIIDSEKMGIYAMGGTANSYNAQSNGSSVTCYKDVLFGKMTDYNCGRMMLTAQYGCPPCTSPDEVKMQVDGAARTADTIFLCEESPAVELSVENVKSTKEPSAAFDVLWFVDKLGTETDAAQVDVKVSSSTYKTKIKWSASKEGTTEKYYVRGRDNEKPTSSDCFAHDSVVVKYNKKPVVPTIEIPSFCKGLVDADVTKYLDNDLKSLLLGLDADIKDPSNAPVTVADLASSLETLAAGTQTYKITVTDIQTGCVSDESSFDVEVKAIPDKPTIDNLDFVVSDVTDQTVKAGATATAGADLHWYSKKSDYPANPSTAVPTISLKDEATFTFWVSQNLDGCESDTASFLVTVNDAPVPAARDTAICVQNSLTNPTPSVDLSTLVEAGDPREPSTAFTLNWYTDPNAAKKTGSATPPTVDYSKVGLQTFYVSQTNSVTGAESNKKAVSVMVYAAHQLSPISPDTYCDEEQNPRALVKYAEDGTTDYEKASDIQWYLYGDAWDKDKLPVLGIEKDTTYIFGAVQSYTITSATGKELETCYSDTTFYTVNVLYTPPTGDSSVAYIAAEVGSDNKTFPAITTKEGWSEEPGYTYYYSEAGKNNFSTSVPKPVYDVSNLNGSTTTILYDVYRIKDGTSKECPSEVKTISVSISDAMPPKVKDYHYCEGSSLQPITAEIRPISGKTENDYELYWYTSKPSSTTTTPDATGSTYSLSGAAAVESDGTIKSTTYYVAQHDVGTGATSAAVEVHVVVYPKPILKIDDPDATCGSDNKFVDITKTWEASNTSEKVTPTYSADVPSAVEESGTYTIKGEYDIPTKAYKGGNLVEVMDEVCVGDEFPVNVEVNYLTVPTIGDQTGVCPGKDIKLTASATSTDPGTDKIKYQWSGHSTQTGSTATAVGDMTTGTNHLFKVTATVGVCEFTSSDYYVKVGDGPVVGSIEISETDNSELPRTLDAFSGDLDSRTLYSCGGEVVVKSNLSKTEGDFEWYDGNSKIATGDVLTIPATDQYSEKTYTIKYINECETQTNFKIVTVPLSVEYVGPDTTVVLCQGEVFETQVSVKCQETTPIIQWYRNTTPVGEKKNASTTTVNNYGIGSVEKTDDGRYNCVVTNRGCTVKANADSLVVHPNVIATLAEGPHVVARHDSKTLALNISVPVDGKLSDIVWMRDGAEVQSGTSPEYTEMDVVADHDYYVTLNDPEYCGTSAISTIWVDAELQLTTELKDTICLGEGEQLRIDTTGTGKFRANNPVELKVIVEMDGITQDISKALKKDGDMLIIDVSPTSDATYMIDFTYGNQHKSSVENVHVIPAISLDLPDPVTICEGDQTELTVQNVAPVGTTVSWYTDETILSATSDSLTVTVQPTYNAESGVKHESVYTYVVIAYNRTCQTSKEYKVPVNVDEPITGEMEGVGVICDGEEAYVDARKYAATTYQWTTSDGDTLNDTERLPSLHPSHSTIYYADMTRGKCSTKESFTVEVKSLPVIASIDSVGYHSREVTLESGTGNAPFMIWYDNISSTADNITHFDNIPFGTHTMHVKDVYNCETSMIFHLDPPEIFIPDHFTPNGDGLSDNWVVPGLAELYPASVVSIYDRYGKLLTQYFGAESEGWDGTYNGVNMPSTDYWYQIDIEEINRQYVGHFTLIRR